MSTSSAVSLALALALALCACACGGRPVGDSSDACPLPQSLSPATQWISPDRCEIEGMGSDGKHHAMQCDGVTCVWRTAGQVVCSCGALNWVNTCGNGLAICVGWNAPLDFSRMDYRSR